MKTYRLFNDNGGFYHLAILDENNVCVYYLVDQNETLVLHTLMDFLAGGDPVVEEWEGGEPNPEKCLEETDEVMSLRKGGITEWWPRKDRVNWWNAD